MKIEQTKHSLLRWLFATFLVLVTGPSQLIVSSPQTSTFICNRVESTQVNCERKYSLMGLQVR